MPKPTAACNIFFVFSIYYNSLCAGRALDTPFVMFHSHQNLSSSTYLTKCCDAENTSFELL